MAAASLICCKNVFHDGKEVNYHKLKKPVSEWPDFLKAYIDNVSDIVRKLDYDREMCLDLSYSEDEILHKESKFFIPKFNELIADRTGKYIHIEETFIRYYCDLSSALNAQLGAVVKPPKTRTIEATMCYREPIEGLELQRDLFYAALDEDITDKVETFWQAYLVWWHAKGKHYKGYSRCSTNPNQL